MAFSDPVPDPGEQQMADLASRFTDHPPPAQAQRCRAHPKGRGADQNDLIWTVNALIDDKLMPAQIRQIFRAARRGPRQAAIGTAGMARMFEGDPPARR